MSDTESDTSISETSASESDNGPGPSGEPTRRKYTPQHFVLPSLNRTDKFVYNEKGFSVTVPNVFGQLPEYLTYTRLTVPQLRERINPYEPKKTRGGNTRSREYQDERLVEDDQPYSFYLAQLIHYGLPFEFSRDVAKLSLKNALENTLRVPKEIMARQRALKREWELKQLEDADDSSEEEEEEDDVVVVDEVQDEDEDQLETADQFGEGAEEDEEEDEEDEEEEEEDPEIIRVDSRQSPTGSEDGSPEASPSAQIEQELSDAASDGGILEMGEDELDDAGRPINIPNSATNSEQSEDYLDVDQIQTIETVDLSSSQREIEEGLNGGDQIPDAGEEDEIAETQYDQDDGIFDVTYSDDDNEPADYPATAEQTEEQGERGFGGFIFEDEKEPSDDGGAPVAGTVQKTDTPRNLSSAPAKMVQLDGGTSQKRSFDQVSGASDMGRGSPKKRSNQLFVDSDSDEEDAASALAKFLVPGAIARPPPRLNARAIPDSPGFIPGESVRVLGARRTYVPPRKPTSMVSVPVKQDSPATVVEPARHTRNSPSTVQVPSPLSGDPRLIPVARPPPRLNAQAIPPSPGFIPGESTRVLGGRRTYVPPKKPAPKVPSANVQDKSPVVVQASKPIRSSPRIRGSRSPPSEESHKGGPKGGAAIPETTQRSSSRVIPIRNTENQRPSESTAPVQVAKEPSNETAVKPSERPKRNRKQPKSNLPDTFAKPAKSGAKKKRVRKQPVYIVDEDEHQIHNYVVPSSDVLTVRELYGIRAPQVDIKNGNGGSDDDSDWEKPIPGH